MITKDLLNQFRYHDKAIFLDGFWWGTDPLDFDPALDLTQYNQRKIDFENRIGRLLTLAKVDKNIIQPTSIADTKMGLNKRALFGINLKIDRLQPNQSKEELAKLREYMADNIETARQVFDGYTYDDQEVLFDTVNFVDFVLAMRSLNLDSY